MHGPGLKRYAGVSCTVWRSFRYAALYKNFWDQQIEICLFQFFLKRELHCSLQLRLAVPYFYQSALEISLLSPFALMRVRIIDKRKHLVQTKFS
jgi:hypothetical protein